MVRKTQIELLQAAKAELEANVPTSSLIADIAYVLKEPELPFTDGYSGPVPPAVKRAAIAYHASLPVDKQFDGKAYDEDLDKARLSKQIERVFEFMKGAQWHTLHDIHIATGAPEASASACLRDFRKERNGSHTVDRRRKGIPTTGVHEYKLILNVGTA